METFNSFTELAAANARNSATPIINTVTNNKLSDVEQGFQKFMVAVERAKTLPKDEGIRLVDRSAGDFIRPYSMDAWGPKGVVERLKLTDEPNEIAAIKETAEKLNKMAAQAEAAWREFIPHIRMTDPIRV